MNHEKYKKIIIQRIRQGRVRETEFDRSTTQPYAFFSKFVFNHSGQLTELKLVLPNYVFESNLLSLINMIVGWVQWDITKLWGLTSKKTYYNYRMSLDDKEKLMEKLRKQKTAL